MRRLIYPRDLRFGKIVAFKESLSERIQTTYEASKDPNYTTFLKHFGTFKVADLETEKVPAAELIFEEFRELRAMIERRLPPEPRKRVRLSSLNLFPVAVQQMVGEALNTYTIKRKTLDFEEFIVYCKTLFPSEFAGIEDEEKLRRAIFDELRKGLIAGICIENAPVRYID